MVRGQYIAGTGMMLQRRMMEVVTNNIVNAETTGYKKDIVVSRTFEDVLIERIKDPVNGTNNQVGPLNWGTRVDLLTTDFNTGNLEGTTKATDIAITGDGFFVVQTPQGERYTRNSAWTVNALGYITDSDGNFLLGQQGPINVGADSGFSIDYRGNITIDNTPAGRLRIVDFEDRTQLRKQGDNLYFNEGAAPVDAEGFEVLQGYLENSNVEIAREMVDMITIYRTYETNQRMLTMIDETVGKAVNDIGRLR